MTVSPLTMTFEVLQKEAVGIIALNEMVCGSASLTMTMFVERVEKRFSKKNCRRFGDVKTKSIYFRPVLKTSKKRSGNCS